MREAGWEKNQGIKGESSGAEESDTRHSGSGEVEEKERDRGGKIGERRGRNERRGNEAVGSAYIKGVKQNINNV